MSNLYQTSLKTNIFDFGSKTVFAEQPKNLFNDSFSFKDTLNDSFKSAENSFSDTFRAQTQEKTRNDDYCASRNGDTSSGRFAEPGADDAGNARAEAPGKHAAGTEKYEDTENPRKPENSGGEEQKTGQEHAVTESVAAENQAVREEVRQDVNKEAKNTETVEIGERAKAAKNNASLLERLLKISGNDEKAGKNPGATENALAAKNNAKTKNARGQQKNNAVMEQNARPQETEKAKNASSETSKTAASAESANAGKNMKNTEPKMDLTTRLEKETGVKIKKMTYENNGGTENNNAGKNGGETELGLLKNLAGNNSRPVIKRESADIDKSGSALKDLAQEGTKAKTANPDVKQAIKTSVVEPRAQVETKDIFAPKAANNQNAEKMILQQADTGNNSQASFARATVAAPLQPSTSATVSNILAMQEIMSRAQGVMKSEAFAANQKMSLDFETGSMGQMHMSLQQKGQSLSVSLEVGNESARDNLMNQRDELARQMRELGYKDVNVDISGKDGREKDRSGKQQARGNEDINNVKLSGNDKLDMSSILAF